MYQAKHKAKIIQRFLAVRCQSLNDESRFKLWSVQLDDRRAVASTFWKGRLSALSRPFDIIAFIPKASRVDDDDADDADDADDDEDEKDNHSVGKSLGETS